MVVAVRQPEASQLTGVELMAHLYRRAGFGATRDQLEAALARGYEATVEELLNPELSPPLEEDLIYRYWPDMKEARQIDPAQSLWVYRMINTQRPLEEKMALFWHQLFATGFAKLNHAKVMSNQVAMLREFGMSNFRTLLVEISRDPAMIFWLDNHTNTKRVHNENYGRELLELFSMGIGNYSEDDVKNCARAFTGWSLKPTIPAAQPYGRFDWEFEFRPDLHDYSDKEFLGETGPFDGTDIIDIIIRQPATAQFLAMRLYKFFVADAPDQDTIDQLAKVVMESNYDVRSMLRWLFLSDAFRSEDAYYAKVKGPAEHVVGVMRFVEDFTYPKLGIRDIALECRYMGQDLLNPPSVEGWHVGKEWIDTGILVERINFAAGQVGDVDKPGVQKLIGRLRGKGEMTSEQLVDACADLMGPLELGDATRAALVDFARKEGNLTLAPGDRKAEERVGAMLSMIVATREFQLV
jgi:uncharacterized protein (DUF1800 family)